MRSGGTTPAGSSRALRLDPSMLPVRFATSDAGADGRLRIVELHRRGVVLRRAVRGMRMAVNLPISAFLGIAIRMAAPQSGDSGNISIMLEHRDPALSVPLMISLDSDDVMAEWQTWARALALPLLVADADGTLREPFARIGAVRVTRPVPRRRRRNAIKTRRPSILLRRAAAVMPSTPPVHRGEHEIIAQD
jgi:hypothetical protein